MWPVAHAHIGPSVTQNNRYVKLTLLGNRVRLLYTFYVGEVPGQQARRRMDADRDGAISEAEARGYGDEIAAEAAANLTLTIDGVAVPLDWTNIDVGLGTPTTVGGAFSVDLVMWACLASPATALDHELVLFDHWQPPEPGETELRVEESPGVTVSSSRLGDSRVSQLRFKWIESRPPHPLDVAGLTVQFHVDPSEADVGAAQECGPATAASAAGTAGARTWLTRLALAGAVVIAIAAAVAIGRRRGS